MAKRKPELIDFIICDDIRSEVGNKVSLMGIYGNTIVIPQMRFRFSKLCFIQRLVKGEGEFKAKTVLSSPSKAIGQLMFDKVIFTGAETALFAIFEAIQIDEVGSYRIETFFDDDASPTINYAFNVALPPQASTQ